MRALILHSPQRIATVNKITEVTLVGLGLGLGEPGKENVKESVTWG